MNTKTSRNSGFILVEVMIVVGLVGLLAVIAVPNFIRARSASEKSTCINNLRQIEAAISQWALQMKASPSAPVRYSDIQPQLRGPVLCPSGGTSFTDSYAISDVQTRPTCMKVPAGPNAHCLAPDNTQQPSVFPTLDCPMLSRSSLSLLILISAHPLPLTVGGESPDAFKGSNH